MPTAFPVFHVDAFTDRPFAGNPAAVCPLESWLPDNVMQSIAAEHNLSETAFIVREDGGVMRIRWFTPRVEVDLCGHATLASAHVVLSELEPGRLEVTFESRSGPLGVHMENDTYFLDFPARPPRPADGLPKAVELGRILGAPPREIQISRDLFLVYASAEAVRSLDPDMVALSRIDCDCLGVIATAPGDEPGVDFVSRFFAPGSGVPEDPVTGSAHCTLIPYWSARLNKRELVARQDSHRGGELICHDCGDRVRIGGRAVTFSRGTITLDA